MPPKRKLQASAKGQPHIKKAAIADQKVESTTFDLKSNLKDASWTTALKDEFEQAYMTKLQTKLQEDYALKKEIFPPPENIFNAFNLTPLDKVKVVILGQDPYHDNGQAEGLAFSVSDGINIPPSLKNIFKELTSDIPAFTTPSSGSLVKWAKQGVLLINATLTVEAHTPNSHRSYGWQTLTDRVITIISDHCPYVVFILWGGFAHKKEKLIDSSKHMVIKDAHPSPLSFTKFKGSKCFSKTNAALEKAGVPTIDWTLSDTECDK